MKKFGKRFDNQLAKKTPYNIYRIGEYRNMHGKTEFECGDCGHTWKTTPSRAIRSVLRCPACKPNQSQEALDWLDDMRTSLNIPIRDAVHGGELRIPGTRFKADGINKKHGIVFEYHGDAVHGNPAVYELNASPSLYNRSLASDLYIKTIEREFSIREAGFVLVRAFGNDVKEGRPPIVSTNYPSKVADTIASKLGTMPVVFSQGMSI
jgi:hypothetical protein